MSLEIFEQYFTIMETLNALCVCSLTAARCVVYVCALDRCNVETFVKVAQRNKSFHRVELLIKLHGPRRHVLNFLFVNSIGL